MMHEETIMSMLKQLDPGEPVVKIRLQGARSLKVEQLAWAPNLPGDSFHEFLINSHTTRHLIFGGPHKGYVIDERGSWSNIRSSVISDFSKVLSDAIPNKNPRRTDIFKKVHNLLRNRINTELLNFIFDVSQYHWSVTKEVSLKHESNDVHRKNIYHLIKLLEQRHGSKKSSIG